MQLWPAAVGKPADYVIFDQANKPETYRQNRYIDLDKDGKITKREMSHKTLKRLQEYTFFDP